MAFSFLDGETLCSTPWLRTLLRTGHRPLVTPVRLTVSSSDDPDARYTDHLDHSYSALHRPRIQTSLNEHRYRQ